MVEKDEKGRFLTGNSGGGRPRGSRNKLGEVFVQNLYADWIEHGEETISRVRAEKPADYLKVVASLLPKELHIKDETLDHLSDDELKDALDAVLALRSGRARKSTRNRKKETPSEAEPDIVH